MAITKDIFDSGLWEAHHIIPKNVLGQLPELQKLLYEAEKGNLKFDFAGLENAIMVQKKLLGITNGHANHPHYDSEIIEVLTEILDGEGIPSLKIMKINKFVKDVAMQIEDEVALGGKDINKITLIFKYP